MKWRPIETAPVAGDPLLLFDKDFDNEQGFEGRFNPGRMHWVSSFGSMVNPTHWQPLPEPPNE